MKHPDEKNIKTIRDLISLFTQNLLIVNPEYQRGVVWTDQQMQMLIDSVLRGYEIPPIYLRARNEDGCHEIIDGQQRINALCGFAFNSPVVESEDKRPGPKPKNVLGRGTIKTRIPPLLDPENAPDFPKFLREQKCPWAGKTFETLEEYKEKFLSHKISVIFMDGNDDEIRVQFIRLQNGTPLSDMEKLDSMPGGFCDHVLIIGGKPGDFSNRHKRSKSFPAELPGAPFFKSQKLFGKADTDYSKRRKITALSLMLFLERREKDAFSFVSTSIKELSACYHRNSDMHIHSDEVVRFNEILDILFYRFEEENVLKLKNHDVIHLILFADMLLDNFANGWQNAIVHAYKAWQAKIKLVQSMKASPARGDPLWSVWRYAQIMGRPGGAEIRERHSIYVREMCLLLRKDLRLPDFNDNVDDLREAAYYCEGMRCSKCRHPNPKNDEDAEKGYVAPADIHFQQMPGHAQGMFYENWALVCKNCNDIAPTSA